MTKQEARRVMKQRRDELTVEERSRREQSARERFLGWLEEQETDWVYPFVSCRTEMDTRGLIRVLLEQARRPWRVAVPRVTGDQMEFVEIKQMEELQPGAMGILEPVTGNIVKADQGIMLLPGLAFDVEGNRVGYGAGYYDRYLEQHDSCFLTKVGYAFAFQIVDRIEAEVYDRKVDMVITDTING